MQDDSLGAGLALAYPENGWRNQMVGKYGIHHHRHDVVTCHTRNELPMSDILSNGYYFVGST